MLMRTARYVSLTALLVLGLLAAPLACDVPSAEAEEAREIHLADLELEVFLRRLKDVTGYSIVWNPTDKNIRGKVVTGAITLAGTPAEIFSAGRALLTFYGLVIVPVGPAKSPIYLVVDSRRTSSILKLKPKSILLNDDNLAEFEHQDGLFVTTTIEVEHMRELRGARNALTRIVTGQNIGNVTEVASANAFVVTDFAPNVVAVYRLLKRMDRPSASSSTTAGATVSIALKHAKAREVALAIRGLFGAPAQEKTSAPQTRGPSAPRVIFDARANRLLVSGTDAETASVREAVALLDIRVEQPALHVALIRLKHIRAVDAAGSLNDLVRSSAGLWRAGARSQSPTLVSHNETNALLVSAAESHMAAIRALVAELDQEVE